MRQISTQIVVSTNGKGLNEITASAGAFVAAQGVGCGLLTVFCKHTSASLLIQENADCDARADLERFFERVAPEGDDYLHAAEGPDDMPAHLRAALTQTHLSNPIVEGAMTLGTWQASTCSSIGDDRTVARSCCTSSVSELTLSE